MMSTYIACDNPEHDRFSHRKEDCKECTPEMANWDPILGLGLARSSNPGIGDIGPLGLMYLKNLTSTQERCTQLLEENRKLRARIKVLSMGLNIKGWFCPHCKGFVGEEKEKQEKCIYCDKPK